MRLYQGEFLVRCYGFSARELVGPGGDLPHHVDPKTYWAMKHHHFFPLDLEKASYHQLLRVPGIGPCLASRLLKLRREGLLSPWHLEKAGINLERSGPFLLLKGKRLFRGSSFQRTLALLGKEGREK
jgi:predicted DNA-binding helix-hairpin-helix protein